MFFARLDPIQGNEQGGTRPVIVISRNAINQNSSVVIAVPTTDKANIKKTYMSHVEIPKGVGGLTLDSVVKVEQMRAFMVKTRFLEYLGHLPDDYIKKLNRAILITLELD